MQSCFVLIWGCPWLFDEEIKLFVQNTRVQQPAQSQYSQMPNKHAARLFVFWKFFLTTRLIRTYTLINFMGKFLPTLVKRVGKYYFYLVPTRLLGPTCLLNSKKFSYLHGYSDSTLIRQLRVLVPSTHYLCVADFFKVLFLMQEPPRPSPIQRKIPFHTCPDAHPTIFQLLQKSRTS